ncbi:MAG: sugar transferase [Candidatus Wallbacteria bacterium]|nr:sugar transferase [Candidatus Wallbacteria bacterium]
MNRREILVSLLFDILLTQVAVLYSFYLRFGYEIPPHEFANYLDILPFFILVTPLIFYFFGIYQINYRYAGISNFLTIPLANFIALLVLTSVVFFSRSLGFSRIILVFFYLLGSFFFMCWRMILLTLAMINWQNKVLLRRVMLISYSAENRNLMDFLQKHPEYGYLPVLKWPDCNHSVRLIGEEVLTLINTYQIDEVFLDTEGLSEDEILKNTSNLTELGITLKLLPGLFDFYKANFEITEVGGYLLLTTRKNPGTWHLVFKDLLDYLVAILVLIFCSPILAVIAALIKFSSPEGNILYLQRRTGKGGKIFSMYKFRTMRPEADKTGPLLTAKNDSRIYPFGRFLRKWSLDELPQLINVIKGDMSLVGPRPEVPEITADYLPWQKRVFQTKPGITGLSQISGRADLSIIEKLKLDLFYIENYNLMLDLKIILKTILVVLRREGAY